MSQPGCFIGPPLRLTGGPAENRFALFLIPIYFKPRSGFALFLIPVFRAAGSGRKTASHFS
ncbi:hypothetical protein AB395_0000290 [Sinorhizobium fredii CCBAU 45436]|nr:hypothetical protein AB395_0000290 [Sinorhizobium fredii CCBAU 45436]